MYYLRPFVNSKNNTRTVHVPTPGTLIYISQQVAIYACTTCIGWDLLTFDGDKKIRIKINNKLPIIYTLIVYIKDFVIFVRDRQISTQIDLR